MILICLTAALAAMAQGDTGSEMRLLRYPSVHGDTVVFTYAGDLWVSNRKGEDARRLTSHPNLETRGRISPDGKWVAFTGSYDGNSDVYVMPIEGGEPKRLTFEPDNDLVIGWTPGGKIMYSSTYGSFTGRQQRLWMVDPKGGLPTRTVVDEIYDGSMASDGHTLYYQRVPSSAFNWRHYRGGTQGRVAIFDFANNSYRELPAQREQSYDPMAVGHDVYYLSDKNQGTLNLYRYDLNSKSDKQLTTFSDADIKWPNTDGKTIVFERDGYLYAYDVASGNVEKMHPNIHGENLAARPSLRQLATSIGSISVSPSGARVAVEARGHIFSVPARAGDTRDMTVDANGRDRFPAWSPDGKTIAYMSDRQNKEGGFDVYLQPQGGGTPTRITTAGYPAVNLQWSPDGKKLSFATRSFELYIVDVETKQVTKAFETQALGGITYDWSPDSKWIAYIDYGKNGFGTVNLYQVANGQKTQVTNGQYSDSRVTFDQTGKYLYFASDRTFAPTAGLYEFSLKVESSTRLYVIPLRKDLPNPLTTNSDEELDKGPMVTLGGANPMPRPEAMRIDIDGLAQRAVVLPLPAGNYYGLMGSVNGLYYGSGATFSRFDLATKDSTPFATGLLGSNSFNASRTKLAYYAGGTLGIVDVRPGIALGQGRVDTSGISAVIDPRKEWNQMFWEAWRFERDNFYDQNIVGLNWLEIGKRYANYLPSLAHRDDLNYILGLMLGELGTGHSYVVGGDMGAGATPVAIGQLGVDFEAAGDLVKLKRIFRGDNFDETRRGPLGEPGINVNEGEYLLAIDGHPVNSSMDPNSLLVDRANKYVNLTVSSEPSMTNARQVRVLTIGSEQNLRYTAKVEENRQYVERATGGRVGYMHIPDTANAGAIAFIEGYYSQTDKDGMIVDERWNSGGFIQPWFVDTLARRSRAGIINRHGSPSLDAVAIEGPKAMLINQYAGSGGDFFPWMFRQAKLGPLIGKRTWGGLVGISGRAPLVDGGNVSSPEFGIYDRDAGQWIAENKGIDPDIDIDLRPDLVAQGKDPQLDAAIANVMAQLKKGGVQHKTPKFPVLDPTKSNNKGGGK